jgi:hypothetical protein
MSAHIVSRPDTAGMLSRYGGNTNGNISPNSGSRGVPRQLGTRRRFRWQLVRLDVVRKRQRDLVHDPVFGHCARDRRDLRVLGPVADEVLPVEAADLANQTPRIITGTWYKT